ncbi:MAG: hypothetical protein Q7T21_09650 [Gallionella sp.]|nr:hypothetical protein [Gallionella sp.]
MGTENVEPTGQGKPDTHSFAAIARRRILLQGVGKGAAVLAATVPIQTLAGQSVLTPGGLHQCTISGAHSGVHSTTTTTTVCGGYSIAHWAAGNANGNGPPSNPWPTLPSPWTHTTSTNLVLISSSLTGALIRVMRLSPTSPEAHWICAWLNALWEEQHLGSLHFPYTGTQVLAYYNLGSGNPTYVDALAFFTTYMEGIA